MPSVVLGFLVFMYHASLACAAFDPENHESDDTHPSDCFYAAWVDSVFDSLTPDERIGQLFFLQAYSNMDNKHVRDVVEQIKKYKVGGLIFFQGGPKRQALLTNRYQQLSKTPLLIGIDAEWGLGMRLDSCMAFPRQMMLGALDDVSMLYWMGNEIGLQCRRMGIHLNFAPVVDINSNPQNPVIGNRAFGENKYDVARRGLMYMSGMQRQHILTAAKHFPGHGNTSTDSHHTLPVIDNSYASLDSVELYPYRTLIKNNLTGVLVAHLYVPSVDSTPHQASSVSPRILKDILRDSLGFNGLVYTDALNMKGVSAYHKPGELEVKALEAGVDVLLMPTDVAQAIKAIREAIAGGRITQEQIDLSCRKILAAKQWAGLNAYRPIDTTGLTGSLNSSAADLLNRQLIEESITVVRNEDRILPLKDLDKEHTAVLLTGVPTATHFLETLKLYEENNYFFFDETTDEYGLLEELSHYSRVIVGIHNTNSSPARNYGITDKTVSLIGRLSQLTNVVLCVFAPPYAIHRFHKDDLAAIVVSYQENPIIQSYTAQLLYGAVPGLGRLSVSADSAYPYRTGIYTPGGLRLKYSVPAEAGIPECRLTAIDSVVQHAIDIHAIPGCQILAARNGVVFFNKTYGHVGYEHDAAPVCPQHIYDLASVTKISAALPAIMYLYDRKQIDLRKRAGNYLPYLEESDKEKMVLIDLLTHQARLQPSINFYFPTMEPIDSTGQMFSRSFDSRHTIRLAAHRYLNQKIRYKEKYYTPFYDGMHQTQVADDLFVLTSYRDTIFQQIGKSSLIPQKRYQYSDLGFILLYQIVEQVREQPINEFVAERFYNRLGAHTLGYHPLKRFSRERVVPTAHDTIFRRQWLRGHVHDETAALMGGVSGHAGLFGNANDLAKLMQMYLNGGIYGGERYIEKKTMEYFTSSPFAKQGNRRGIGFDKPESDPEKTSPAGKGASLKSFGHSGFTGTYTWADPETGLLFVFLSNRINPDDSNNVLSELNLRTQIYDILADAVQSSETAKE